MLTACAAPPIAPLPAAPSSPAPSAAAPKPAAAPQTFDFHSGFWLNLHLRLHQTAIGMRPPPDDAPKPPKDAAWTDALEYYRSRFGERGGFGIVFDDELHAIQRALAALPSDAERPVGVDDALAAQLSAAAALVRAEWSAEDQRNRAWVAALEPLLSRHAGALREALAAAYATPWPTTPLRVEVSCFAGPVGAFTVTEPSLISISSCDLAFRDEAALEMIFHEASHTLVDVIEKKLEAEATRRGKPAPRDLWHGVLFYATGAIVARELGGGYVPYATTSGLWDRGFPGFEPALRVAWQPYLDGQRDLDTAIAALLDELD